MTTSLWARLIVERLGCAAVDCAAGRHRRAAGHRHTRRFVSSTVIWLGGTTCDSGMQMSPRYWRAKSSSPRWRPRVGGGDGPMVLDHEIVFMSAPFSSSSCFTGCPVHRTSTNYRIDQRSDMVVAAVHTNEYQHLITHDQLTREIWHNRGFRLCSFTEGAPAFAPTYNYDRRTTGARMRATGPRSAVCPRGATVSCNNVAVIVRGVLVGRAGIPCVVIEHVSVGIGVIKIAQSYHHAVIRLLWL